MAEKFQLIDAHGHIGRSFLGPSSDLKEYVAEARKIGVRAAIVSPGPSPEILGADNQLVYYPCLWQATPEGVTYHQMWYVDDIEQRRADVDENPYHDTNLGLLTIAASTVGEPHLMVMPIHHPVFDTDQEVRSLLQLPDVVALKVHGIATFTGPDAVSDRTIDALKASRKPLVVHCDTFRGQITHPVQSSFKLNNPAHWVAWAKETGVKTLITHGARLDEAAIRDAMAIKNIKIGLAPDLLLQSEPQNLAQDTDDFLSTLFAIVSPEQLLFDIDFGWNVAKRDDWLNHDWAMLERIQIAARENRFSLEDLDNIFYFNAVHFYDI